MQKILLHIETLHLIRVVVELAMKKNQKTIILVRHAKAQDRTVSQKLKIKEGDRPLTSTGKAEFKKSSKKYLKSLKKTDLFVTSPWLRARQTLEIIFENLKVDVATLTIFNKCTSDDNPKNLIAWLKKREEKQIVVVSHEPFISEFLKAVQGEAYKAAKIKKGSLTTVQI